MVRTTPPRLVDLEELFPGLSRYARTTTLLHPRWGAPGVEESSVGGPLLWPSDEPWPACAQEHEAGIFSVSVAQVRAERARKAAETLDGQVRGSAGGAVAKQLERLRALAAGTSGPIPLEQLVQVIDHGVPGPVPLLPVAQLFARDVPGLPVRPGTDLLQVLWCPFDHDKDESFAPSTHLVWRDSAAVDRGTLLTEPPQPSIVEYGDYIPSPCVLHPEQVVEYPLTDELREVLDPALCLDIAEWCLGRALDAEEDVEENEPYDNAGLYDEIAASPSFKVGGWMFWGNTDPRPVHCPCGAAMTPLLQIGSGEWWSDAGYWTPIEDLDAARGRVATPHSFGNPPEIVLPRGLRLHLYLCPDDPGHARLQVLG